jgi:predicted component of type VI protein secretion system
MAMSSSKVRIVVIVIAAGAVATILMRGKGGSHAPRDMAHTAPAAARTAPNDSSEPATQAETQARVDWPHGIAHDPFRASRSEPVPDAEAFRREAAARLRVGGILFGSSPTVLINGVARKEGEIVEGFRLLRIRRDTVVLEQSGESIELQP